MNIKKLIEEKTICEIRLDNNFETFDVGIIFHTNEDSVFVKCFRKDGEVLGYEMLPIDYIRAISYDTKYIEDLNIRDVTLNENMNFLEWNCAKDVFEYLKKEEAKVSFYDYEDKEMVSGIIENFDADSVTLRIFDNDNNEFDGKMILNISDYYCLEWGKL